jgi:hypothetical protein
VLFVIAGFVVMRIRRDVRGVARGIYSADVADSAAA